MEKGEFNRNIGSRIRQRREQLGMTREAMCELIDLSPQFLSELERGVRGVSARTVYKVCAGLGVSADYIVMGRESVSGNSRAAALADMIEALDDAQYKLMLELAALFLANAAKPGDNEADGE